MTDSALRQAREALQAVTFTDRTAMDSRGVAQVPFATLKKCADAIAAIDAAPVEQQVHADLPAVLRSVIAHWDEFGPEHGFDECIDQARRALGGLLPVVQPGWKLVPVEPTPEMVNAGFQAWDDFDKGLCEAPGCVWDAMLAAAPKEQG
jgi:hypothetical protein